MWQYFTFWGKFNVVACSLTKFRISGHAKSSKLVYPNRYILPSDFNGTADDVEAEAAVVVEVDMEDKVNVEGHGDEDEDNDDVCTNEIGLGVEEKDDDEYTMSVVVVVEPPLVVVVGVGAIGSTIIFLVVVAVEPPEGEWIYVMVDMLPFLAVLAVVPIWAFPSRGRSGPGGTAESNDENRLAVPPWDKSERNFIVVLLLMSLLVRVALEEDEIVVGDKPSTFPLVV